MKKVFLATIIGLLGGSVYLLLLRLLLLTLAPPTSSYLLPAYPLMAVLLCSGLGGIFWGLGEGLGRFASLSPLFSLFRKRVLLIALASLLLTTSLWAFLGYATGRQGQIGNETTQIRAIRRQIQEKKITSQEGEAKLAPLEKKLMEKTEDGRSSFLAWQWSQNATLSLFPVLGLFGGLALLRQRIISQK